tara:strand:- start:235 stop:636 length:402 start_codon:yes stop_codon:yes gene_type:complete
METRISAFDALIEMKAPFLGTYSNITFNIDHDYEIINWVKDVSSELIPTKEEVTLKINQLQADLPMKHLREHRRGIIKDTDIYSLPDYPHKSETIRQAWLNYRQQLRNLPSNSSPQLNDEGNLTNVTWPTPPS